MTATESEQYVIGALLLSNRVLADIGDILTADDFEGHDHRIVYAEACGMIRANLACDLITLTERMTRQGQMPASLFAYIGGIVADMHATGNIRAHAELVAEHARRRRLVTVAETVVKDAPRLDSDQMRAIMQTGLANIEHRTGGHVLTFAEAVEEASEAMNAACNRRERGEPVGIGLGIPCVDNAIGGFADGQLWTIAARPGVGKTAMALQFGIRAGLSELPGLMISLEMQPRELATRALSLRSGQNVGRLFQGYRDSVRVAENVAPGLASIPFHIDAHTRSLDPIIARIGQYANRKGIKWAIVDHIGLVETKAFASRNDQVGAVSRGLKTLAMELNIPIIALSQLNRGSEKDQRQPGLADLRDSGNIEQDVDGAIFLHRKKENEDKTVQVQIGILKNRNGPCVWLNDEIIFDGRVQQFRQISREYE